MRKQVRSLQRKLFRAAKQSLDRRFGALYDKVYREDVLWMAWTRVKANQGAPGVDGQSIAYIEEEIGVERFLSEIREDLHRKRYRPQAVRRCWIKKPGKLEKRPLGIPVIRDRVVQMAVKIVIEPIFEANFLPCSYGFRPKRNAHMALRKIRWSITYGGQTQVIDADIRGCFDAINHGLLMRLVRRRISDPRILKLIQGWLQADVLDQGTSITSAGVGTPQGGVISPLLANIYLHAFDKMFAQSGIEGTLVRYADDFVILTRGNAKPVLERVRQMMNRLGLELHPEKTRIVHAQDGFDFLGVHLRQCTIRRSGHATRPKCLLWPSDWSLARIKQRIRQVVGRRYGTSLEHMIADLNPVLRGWHRYHTTIRPVRDRLRKLNLFVRERLRIFLKRKHGDQTRGYGRVSGNLLARLGLFQFA